MRITKIGKYIITTTTDNEYLFRYPFMVMSVALDGRNEDGTEDPTLKFFPIIIDFANYPYRVDHTNN